MSEDTKLKIGKWILNLYKSSENIVLHPTLKTAILYLPAAFFVSEMIIVSIKYGQGD